MATTPTYKPSIPQLLIELFKADLPESTIKWYREGDPIQPPQSKLPAMFVSEPNTRIGVGPTGMDAIEHDIVIQIVLNKKSEFGNPDATASLDKKLDEIVMGRDEVTGDFKEGTVMNILRRNLTLDNVSVDTQVTVRKGVVSRPEDLTTVEAHVEVTINELQLIANRT